MEILYVSLLVISAVVYYTRYSKQQDIINSQRLVIMRLRQDLGNADATIKSLNYIYADLSNEHSPAIYTDVGSLKNIESLKFLSYNESKNSILLTLEDKPFEFCCDTSILRPYNEQINNKE
jgi:hypothetical protein